MSAYLDRIAASQAKAEMIYNNQLAYARNVVNDPYLPWGTKEFLLQVEGLSWAIKVILEESIT
jgi:hypothetical protein